MERASRSGVAVRQSYLLFISFLVILFIATSASFVFSQTNQYQSIKGVKFKDGTVIRGQVVQLSTDTVTIKTPDGNTFVRKFDEVDVFIKQDGDFAEPSTLSSPYGSTFISPEKRNYLTLKGGIYSPQSNDMDGFDTGFNGEIALGYYFNKNLAMEFSVGYFNSSYSVSGSTSVFVSGAGSVRVTGNANIDLWVIPVTLALKAIYPIDKLELYAIGGIGAYFANADMNYNGTASSGSISVSGSGSLSSSDTAFGGFLGAGANFNIDQYWYIGLESKYFWARPEFTFLGQGVSQSIDGWIVTGNIGVRF
jgi:outer membrane protein W